MHLTIGNDCEHNRNDRKTTRKLRSLRLKHQAHPGIYPSCLDNPLPSLCCFLLRLLRVDLGQGMHFLVRKKSVHVGGDCGRGERICHLVRVVALVGSIRGYARGSAWIVSHCIRTHGMENYLFAWIERSLVCGVRHHVVMYFTRTTFVVTAFNARFVCGLVPLMAYMAAPAGLFWRHFCFDCVEIEKDKSMCRCCSGGNLVISYVW